MHFLPDDIEKYIEDNSSPEEELLRELTRETYLKVQMPQMLSGHVQGKFLQMICRNIQAKRVLEIGTFTGFTAIHMAKGMTADGMLYTIDINEELAPMVSRYVEKANLSGSIKQLIGDAKKLIPEINETFDLVFIDADKASYSTYYDLVFDKVRPGGYIIADNVLWDGKVVNEKKDKDTLNIVAYNTKVALDKRVDNFILSLRDGLNIAQKLG